MNKLKSKFKAVVGAPVETLFVAVYPNPNANQYVYTTLWYNSLHDFCVEVEMDEQFEEANTQLCESHAEAYAYAFEAIKDALLENPNIKIIIIDLTDEDDE